MIEDEDFFIHINYIFIEMPTNLYKLFTRRVFLVK